MVPAGVDLFSRFDLESSGGRIPAMEGLRAYAVLLTFCVHFFGAWMLQFRGIDTGVIALSVLILAGALFLVAERPYCAAQRREHA